ncbi:MAG: carboxypeptidase-like regulatory domain-containing protein, partial [Acidobacteriota bacterium]|nr:carboxypeptidase-like regulatory domain-containing protein [Acidobacteriota bacterium]
MKFDLCNHVLSVLLVLLTLATVNFAQESRATLTGRVSDQAGAAVPNATVIIKNQQTNIETTVTTGDEGNYTVTALQPGRYTVSVESQGFKRAESDMVELFTASTATFDVS